MNGPVEPVPDSVADDSPPPGVPRTAVWVDVDGEWQVRQFDAEGNLDGAFRSWRADGTPRTICAYEHGKEVGPVWKFHPDGSLFSLGCFVAGVPRGVHRRYGNSSPDGERLQSCCVPPGAWTLREEYPRPNFIDRGWFNRDGERLLESGALHPIRPAGVPADAWYSESEQLWQAGVTFEEVGLTGTRRCWSGEGVLKLSEQLCRGQRHGEVQLFGEDGSLVWRASYVRGRLHGPFFATGLPPGHFTDVRACSQSGSFRDDQAEGIWRTLDAGGTVIDERDLGGVYAIGGLHSRTEDLATNDESGQRPVPPLPDELVRSAALANEHRSAEAWRETAAALFGERRVGEGLVATARAAAQAEDARELASALRAHTVPLGREAAVEEARRARESTSPDNPQAPSAAAPVVLLDSLKRGAEPAATFWALAKALPDGDLLALDLVNAALLLAPSATDVLTTRTLLLAALGDLQAARADVARLMVTSPEQGAFLDLYLRIYFPRFAFWPATEPLNEVPEDVTLQPSRTPAEVRQVIQRYATRLERLREALAARLGATRGAAGAEVPFMIPDLRSLLPEGPLPLSRWSFQLSAAEYGGGIPQPDQPAGNDEDQQQQSTIEITVDETQGLEPVPGAILQILRRARADWSGIVWLCWAVGLDQPGLPEAIRPPAAFAGAAVMTMERTWRCRDKLRTSGLLALTKGIPGFDWEGTSIDLVPAALVDVAVEEYLEARAVFSWLCDPLNRSPWQDDLRSADD